jgi:hypothetical protein
MISLGETEVAIDGCKVEEVDCHVHEAEVRLSLPDIPMGWRGQAPLTTLYFSLYVPCLIIGTIDDVNRNNKRPTPLAQKSTLPIHYSFT